jgi:hypothetical protein
MSLATALRTALRSRAKTAPSRTGVESTVPRHESGRSGSGLKSRIGVAVASVGMLTLGLPMAHSYAATTTYYVAPNGSDSNPGTLDLPFKTVAKGLHTVQPGGTLYLRGGTYAERIKSVGITPGTSSAPVTVRAYGTEKPTLSGLLWLTNPSYWNISGLTVTWGSSGTSDEHMVKMTGGTGWNFTGNTLSNAHSYAALLVAGTASNWHVSGNTITNTYKSNDTNQDHLIYVNGTGYGVIERNFLFDSPNGRAVKVMGTHSGLLIRYNTMERNTGPSNIQVTEEVDNLVVEKNIMVDSAPNRPAVTAFAYTGSNNIIRNNLVWHTNGVVQSEPGLINGGGNIVADPAGYRSEYGATAGTTDPTPTTPTPTTGTGTGTVTFVKATTASGANGTSVVVPTPEGIASGDLLLASLLVRGAPTVTAAAGWSVVQNTPLGTTARLITFSKVATATEPASATFVLSSSQANTATIAAYHNAKVATGGAATGTTSRSIVAPSVTATGPGTLVTVSGVSVLAGIAPDFRLAERSEVATPSTATYKATLETADAAITTAGDTGTRTATSTTSGQVLAHSIALVPVA